MQITDYEVFDVPPRWVLVRLETSDGTVGWGEASLSRQRHAVRGAVTDLVEPFVLGAAPDPIEDRWQQMYRYGRFRGGPVLMTAMAGIDQALWDIKGRVHDLPVHEFLGGRVRDRVRLYQHLHTAGEISGDIDAGGDAGPDPELLARDAAAQVEAGFTALKFLPTGRLRRVDTPAAVAAARDRMAAVREAVGDDVDVGVDFHGRVSKTMAKQLAVALEEFGPMFYEEPVGGPEHADDLPELGRHTSVPIATGERRHSRWDFKELFEDRSVDIVQPDLCYAGGISEVRRIGAMAEAYDVVLAPHCPYGPIALAASLQIDACTPNATIQEQIVHRTDYFDVDALGYVENPDVLAVDDDGYAAVPDGPGLGVEVDEEAVRDLAGGGSWAAPQWRHGDGSVAEW